ncbi:hypothetical protein PTSG_12396 [Salpingoeca rosetta]|uniref:Uncharacterized protein n=1 Tax=Salpingoeca rosetta (strain ATCC 50818 / BSB-021) TaxID=946362 RepID=F2UDP7_SALR5|nr:uncharacterized protein PTSG_12396 [Salpingoeca rosetta]EGD74742.1 hypothetical protein PTSG_12396 [Salpingoeca rosetta]|eukprot:XP_004992999.1 hypothetical protein PTSG_12396 [Salpingoeca rosetta]
MAGRRRGRALASQRVHITFDDDSDDEESTATNQHQHQQQRRGSGQTKPSTLNTKIDFESFDPFANSNGGGGDAGGKGGESKASQRSGSADAGEAAIALASGLPPLTPFQKHVRKKLDEYLEEHITFDDDVWDTAAVKAKDTKKHKKNKKNKKHKAADDLDDWHAHTGPALQAFLYSPALVARIPHHTVTDRASSSISEGKRKGGSGEHAGDATRSSNKQEHKTKKAKREGKNRGTAAAKNSKSKAEAEAEEKARIMEAAISMSDLFG